MQKNEAHNELLRSLVVKLYKCTLPSTVQGIALLFSRYFMSNFEDMVAYLRALTVKGTKVGIKIVMDRWLLHQPRFIGRLTKNCTYEALMVIFASRHAVFNDLLVLGFDPSHTKDSPEVYAPLKILSTLIRCYHNEKKASYKDMGADQLAEKYRQNMQEDGRLATYDDDAMDEEDGDEEGFEDGLGEFGGMDVGEADPGARAHPARFRGHQDGHGEEEGEEGRRVHELGDEFDVYEFHVRDARVRRDGQRGVR